MSTEVIKAATTRALTLLGLFALFMTTAQAAPFQFQISGVVVNQENQRVAGAKVCAWPRGGISGRVPCGDANGEGQFSFYVERADHYTMTAENIAEGYPDAYSSFYGKLFGDCPVVNLTGGKQLEPVQIRLGPRAGRVKFMLVNARTGRPIETGMIKVNRVNQPSSHWWRSSAFPGGKYEMLTPEVPFEFEFQRFVHNKWISYSAVDESGHEIRTLQVGLGEQKELTLRLK